MSSCGDLVFAVQGGDASVGIGGVAMGDVVVDGALGGVPAGSSVY
jgi:hypothetical protein